VAVDDFLTSWLVEGKPNLAVAYLDRAAYDCLAERLEKKGKPWIVGWLHCRCTSG